MKWTKQTGTKQVAIGKVGQFAVEKHRGLWWARYISQKRCFTLPPNKKIAAVKEMVADNIHWEE